MAEAMDSRNLGIITWKILGSTSVKMMCRSEKPNALEACTKPISLTCRALLRTTLAVEVHHREPMRRATIQKLGRRNAANTIIKGIWGIMRKISVIPMRISSVVPLK